MASEIYRVLQPGGYSIHIIGLDDHLAHYDKNVAPKNYYRYSDTVWRLFFQNKLQYFNRIQASDWLRFFDNSGFTCVEKETSWSRDVGNLRVNKKYESYSQEDLSCCRLTMVHRKPL